MKNPTPTELYATHVAWVELYARGFAKSRGVVGAAAEDYVSVALVGLWEASEQFDGRGRFHSYAAQRVFWEMLGEWEKMDRRRSVPIELESGGDRMEIRELGRHDEGFERAERLELFKKVMTWIPSGHRKVVRLVFCDGMTMQDAGRELGVTKQRVHQILRKYNIQVRG